MALLSEQTKKENPLKQGGPKKQKSPTKEAPKKEVMHSDPPAFSQEGGSFGMPNAPREEPKTQSTDPKQNNYSPPAKKESPVTEDQKLFFGSYEITEDDFGYTPEELYDLKTKETIELSDEDMELFDQLLFQGYASYQFNIRKASATVRSFSYQLFHDSVELQQKYTIDGRRTSEAVMQCLQVARALYSWNGKPISSLEFESKEGLEERLNWVMRQPTIVIDSIGTENAKFVRRLMKVQRHGLENF